MPTFDGREAYSFSTTSPGQAPVGVWAAAGVPTNAPLIQTRNATGAIVTTINADGEVVAPKATITTLAATTATLTTATITTLSGTPSLPSGATATTQAVGDNSTKIATTAFVNTSISAPSAFMVTPFLPVIAAGTATVMVGDKTYFQYIGRASDNWTTCTGIVYYLKTQLVANVDPSSDFAEFSLWKGTPSYAASPIPATLTRLGFVDCYTGPQFIHAANAMLSVPITSLTISPGDDLWLGTSQHAQTLAQFVGNTIDAWGLGVTLIADGRSSTIGTAGVLSSGITLNTTVSGVAALVYFS